MMRERFGSTGIWTRAGRLLDEKKTEIKVLLERQKFEERKELVKELDQK